VRLRDIFFAPIAAILFAAAAVAADAPAPPAGAGLDFSLPDAVLDLGPSLAPGQAGGYSVTATNGAAQQAVRILQAAPQPADGVALMPPSTRPRLTQIVSADPTIRIERAEALGADTFRVTVPAMGMASLALQFEGTVARPILLAWQEPALVTHERQKAILVSAAAGLSGAGFAFALGAAVLSGTLFARWAAVFLAGVFFSHLAGAGVFDDTFLTAWSGPHAIFALGLAGAVAAGIRFVDCIAPFETAYRGLGRWRDVAALGLLGLGLLAYAGVPFFGFLIRVLAMIGAAAAAAYLAHCGRSGNGTARRLAPAATIFSLVTLAAGFNALGLFGLNLVASDAIGGFSAAGAMVVAIATALPTERAMRRKPKPQIPETALTSSAPLSAQEQRREIAAVTASHQGVFDLDMTSGLVSLSSEAAQLFGLPPAAVELTPEAWLGRIHSEDRGVFKQAIKTYRDDPGIAFRIEFRARAQGARMAWFELRASMTGQGNEAQRCLGLIANVTARKKAENDEGASNPFDPLTGLGMQAALLARLEALRTDAKIPALAIFDLDRFKSVNDSLGREGGDALLIALVDRLSDGFAGREGGPVLFRLGGDMFAAMADGIADPKVFGERLVEMLGAPFTINGRDIYLPSSVGVATGDGVEEAQDLLVRSELAMVEAKRQGGSRVVLYSSVLGHTAPPDLVALETDLRRALEKDEIEVHYQPIVRLRDGAVAGFEALMRWRHPERGLIEPEAFVPQAERSGLIVPLGGLALRRAAEDLTRWQHFFPSKPPLFVSVNVTWRQIADKNFAKELVALLRASVIAKRSLKLEVTESQVMEGSGRAEIALRRLKSLGVGLSIDDFGTGHSSLSRLAGLPFDTIKIDKSFLAASVDVSGAKVLSAMISLARELKLSVVCEGVETVEERDRLKAMGCEFGQGYLLGAPVPASEIDGRFATAQIRSAH
jgi:diguanylate cyclase (GGDEF)-like protein